MIDQKTLDFRTRGRGTTEITAEVARAVARSGIGKGLCTVFLQHTSASLILCENADPDVRRDLETLLARLAPDGDPAYRHDTEGPDDMAAHARSILTSNSFTIPVADGQAAAGHLAGPVPLGAPTRAARAQRGGDGDGRALTLLRRRQSPKSPRISIISDALRRPDGRKDVQQQPSGLWSLAARASFDPTAPG